MTRLTNQLIISLILLAVCMSTASWAQNSKTKRKLDEIKGEWKQDSKGQVSYVRIVEVPNVSKTKLLERAKNYFVHNYLYERSVVKMKEENVDAGYLLYKGFYNDIHSDMLLLTTTFFDVYHTIRIDAKDGKCRIIFTFTEYEIESAFDDQPPAFQVVRYENEYPINTNGEYKNAMGKSFYNSHKAAQETMDALVEALKLGNLPKEFQTDDW